MRRVRENLLEVIKYQMPFTTKDLLKAIMKRSRLRNNFLKNRTGENKTFHTKQGNYCVSLLKKI